MQVCFDGDVYRRLLPMPAASAEQRLRAALALTRAECAPGRATPRERQAHEAWRADVLDQLNPTVLAPHLKNRWLLRRAGIAASLAYARPAAAVRETTAANGPAMPWLTSPGCRPPI